MSDNDKLKQLPSVHEVLDNLPDLAARLPHDLLLAEVRRAIDRTRAELLSSGSAPARPVEAVVRNAVASLESPSLRRVINATGVVLHTNLGRAPLADTAPVRGYSNLEYDLSSGKRGKRDVHIASLIERLLGKPGIGVNNNASAVYLVLNALASGGEVIVSRGELVEIGEGFRIPEIMAHSGAVLREVGTTNKTHLDDYRRAIGENTRLIMAVHRSNFRITGFTSRPGLAELAGLARGRRIPLYQDLGSGCIADLRESGIDEPLPSNSLRDGVDVVSFSGDKLLGGPQAGIIAGDANLVSSIRRHPMFRALRLDKLAYRALEETLRCLLLGRIGQIPALRMISLPVERIRERAEEFLSRITSLEARVEDGESVIGGGSTPQQSLATALISIGGPGVVEMERRLRMGDPPVIARIEDGRLLLDLRTVFPEEEPELAAALRKAAG